MKHRKKRERESRKQEVRRNLHWKPKEDNGKREGEKGDTFQMAIASRGTEKKKTVCRYVCMCVCIDEFI